MFEPPHPAQNPVLIGHETTQKTLEATLATGKLPAAWLLTGPEGIGKATLAYHLAICLLSGRAGPLAQIDPTQSAARLVAQLAHPDLFVLERPLDEKTGRPKDVLPVEAARALPPFLHMTATHAPRRVALIDSVHTLNRFGQNAILKSIEEPPPGSVVIMTATTAGALLPTIRSRCRILAMEPLSEREISTIALRLGSDPLPAEILRLAEGSVGQALKLARTGAIELYASFQNLMASAPRLDPAKLAALSDGLARKADQEVFDVLSSLILADLRHALKARARETPLPEGFAGRLAQSASLDRMFVLWEKSRETFAMADKANLDRKLAFLGATEALRAAFEN